MAGRQDIQASAGLDLSDIEKSLQILLKRIDSLEEKAASADAALQKIQKTSADAAGSLGKFGQVLNALGLGISIASIAEFGRSLLSFGVQTKEASETAGLTAENFQRLKAELMGFVSADVAAASINSLAQALRAAQQGSAEEQDAFVRLGLSIKEVTDPATNVRTLIESLATAYSNAADKTEFLRLATQTFGADFLKLVPALSQGGDALKKIGDNATVASNSVVDMAARGTDALQRFSDFTKQTALGIAGYLADLGEKINSYIPNESAGPTNRTSKGVKLDPKRFPHRPGEEHIKAAAEKAAQAAQDGLSDDLLRDIAGEPKKKSTSDTQPGKTPSQSAQEQKAQRDSELQIQEDLNAVLATRTTTLKSQSEILYSQLDATARRMKLEENLNDPLKLGALKAQYAEQQKAITELDYQIYQTQQLAKLQSSATQLELEGQTHLADIAKVRLQFASKIMDATKDGNQELVDQLNLQQNIALLQADQQLYLQSSAQQQAAITISIKDQIALNQAQRARDAQSASDKNTDANGQPIDPTKPYGRKDIRGFIPSVKSGPATDNNGNLLDPFANFDPFGFGKPDAYGFGDLGKHVNAPSVNKSTAPKAPPTQANPIIKAASITTDSISANTIRPAK